MAKRERQPGIPRGTLPDIFSVDSTTLSVPLSEMGSGTWLDLEYDDEEHAKRAWQILSERLQDSSSPSASELRREYSIANMINFLVEHLARQGFCDACVDALIRVDADGLQGQLPNGDWIPLQYDNVRATTAVWRSKKARELSMSSAAAAAYRYFHLSLGLGCVDIDLAI